MTDNGELQSISTLTAIEALDVRGCSVTNDGLQYVAGMKNLRYLGLGGLGIDTIGAQHLASLKRLETPYLDNTSVRFYFMVLARLCPKTDNLLLVCPKRGRATTRLRQTSHNQTRK